MWIRGNSDRKGVTDEAHVRCQVSGVKVSMLPTAGARCSSSLHPGHMPVHPQATGSLFLQNPSVASAAQAHAIAVHLKWLEWLWCPARLSSAVRDRLSTCDRSPCLLGSIPPQHCPRQTIIAAAQRAQRVSSPRLDLLESDIGAGNGRCCNENIPFLLVKSMMRLIF